MGRCDRPTIMTLILTESLLESISRIYLITARAMCLFTGCHEPVNVSNWDWRLFQNKNCFWDALWASWVKIVPAAFQWLLLEKENLHASSGLIWRLANDTEGWDAAYTSQKQCLILLLHKKVNIECMKNTERFFKNHL